MAHTQTLELEHNRREEGGDIRPEYLPRKSMHEIRHPWGPIYSVDEKRKTLDLNNKISIFYSIQVNT